MPRELSHLTPTFRPLVEQLLAECEASGFPMRPFYTLRSPFEQGGLWRQSRSGEEVRGKIAELRAKGAAFLAHCIESVGPRDGRHVTNAIPGMSWHQWGEAVDCYWLLEGRAEWSTRRQVGGANGYAVYAEKAAALGLNPGGHWRSFKDWPHVQLQAAGSPGRVHSLEEIDREMQQRFGSEG